MVIGIFNNLCKIELKNDQKLVWLLSFRHHNTTNLVFSLDFVVNQTPDLIKKKCRLDFLYQKVMGFSASGKIFQPLYESKSCIFHKALVILDKCDHIFTCLLPRWTGIGRSDNHYFPDLVLFVTESSDEIRIKI